MSWLFSQVLVAGYSEATSWDGAPSAPLSVMPTRHKFWRNDKMMDASRLSQFGLTCAVLTENHGEDLLTWFREVSLAKTYPLLGQAPVLMAPGRDYGVRWRELSARYDHDSSSWKTHRCLWEEDLPWSSVTLPRWGMTLNGHVFQHPTSERPISAIASGLWPTPTVCGNHNKPGASKSAGWGLSSAVKSWPTPTASLGTKGGRITPRKSREGGTLIEAVSARTWPTPAASDATKWSHQSLAERKSKGQQVRLPTAVSPEGGKGGQLNPAWVEWLMGWPIGWTELKPLAMDRFQEWLQQHSLCLEQKAEDIAA